MNELSQEEKHVIEAITRAAYFGDTERDPEEDVRFLLYVVGKLVK